MITDHPDREGKTRFCCARSEWPALLLWMTSWFSLLKCHQYLVGLLALVLRLKGKRVLWLVGLRKNCYVSPEKRSTSTLSLAKPRCPVVAPHFWPSQNRRPHVDPWGPVGERRERRSDNIARMWLVTHGFKDVWKSQCYECYVFTQEAFLKKTS